MDEAESQHALDWYPEPVTEQERSAWNNGEPTDSLAMIDWARSALARAKTLPDIGAIREVAERARRYASAAKLGRAAENHAARVRIEAERKAGQLLADMEKNEGGRPKETSAIVTEVSVPRITDLGITHRQSSDWQRIARIPTPVFEAHVQAVTKVNKPLTTEGVVQVARKIEKEQRAAEPKPIIPPSSIPARIEVADARSMPLDDETVDLIVTSPPYGLDIAYEGGDVTAAEWPTFMRTWLAEALRVTKRSGRLALNVPLDTTVGGCRPTYAEAVVAALAAGWTYKATLVWHENNTTKGNRGLGSVNSSARPHPVDSSEMIVLFSKGEWGPSSENPDTITPDEWQLYGHGPWSFSGESRAWESHPAPFPEELPHRLIRYLCRRGDVVLDPFSGSGTTVAVAIKEDRQAIGFDVSETCVHSAQRRVATCAA